VPVVPEVSKDCSAFILTVKQSIMNTRNYSSSNTVSVPRILESKENFPF
jgi:hypothetical protein